MVYYYVHVVLNEIPNTKQLLLIKNQANVKHQTATPYQESSKCQTPNSYSLSRIKQISDTKQLLLIKNQANSKHQSHLERQRIIEGIPRYQYNPVINELFLMIEHVFKELPANIQSLSRILYIHIYTIQTYIIICIYIVYIFCTKIDDFEQNWHLIVS